MMLSKLTFAFCQPAKLRGAHSYSCIGNQTENPTETMQYYNVLIALVFVVAIQLGFGKLVVHVQS
jgi:hypothetical protein